MNQRKTGAFLSYIAIFVHMVVGLIYTPYMLRVMGQSEFGIFSLASSVISYLTILDLGFGNAVIRYTAKLKAENDRVGQQKLFGMFIMLYVVIGIVAFICGALLSINADRLFSEKMTPTEVERTKIMLWLMSFNLAVTFPMSIWGAIMSAYERFIFQRVVSIIRSVLNPLVMVILLFYGYRAIAMVVVTTVFNFATLFINYTYCKKILHIKVLFSKVNWGFLKEVSMYSFWVFLTVIMDKIYWSSGQFILGIFQGSKSIAVYSVSIQLLHMFMLFSTAISGVFLPRITEMVVNGNDRKAISDVFVKTGRVQYISMAFILTGFILFGQSFIRLWAGEGYENSYRICMVFFIPLTVPLIQNLAITILQARNEMKFRSLLYLAIAILCLILCVPLGKYYGELGCAVATSFALILGQVILINIYYHKKQGLNICQFWKEIGKMSIVPIFVMILCHLLLKWFEIDTNNLMSLSIAILGYSTIYFPLFWFFSMNNYERGLFRKPIRKIFPSIAR